MDIYIQGFNLIIHNIINICDQISTQTNHMSMITKLHR